MSINRALLFMKLNIIQICCFQNYSQAARYTLCLRVHSIVGLLLEVWEISQFCNFFDYDVIDTGIVTKLKITFCLYVIVHHD